MAPKIRARKAPAKIWKSEQLGRNVFRLNVHYRRNREWEWWFLLTSDQHWDNPHSNHELQLKHLKEARERNAGVLSAGDYFCLMQGKFDKRASKHSIRPEHQVDNYLDAVLKTGADFLEPYADMFVLIATGNHEQAIENRHETNMIDRFVGILNDRTGSHIENGGYSGYLIFSFQDLNNKATQVSRINLRYEHGAGGGAPVTGGMIDSFRRAVYFPDAHIILSGHTHDQWVREFARQRVSWDGTLSHDIQTHIKIPSYKDEFGEGFGGWATAAKGMPPKPIGAYWLRFFYCPQKMRVLYEVIQAR